MASRRDGDRSGGSEATLEWSAEHYRLLAENIDDVIWTLDARTLRLSYVSPSILKLRGLTVEEAMAEPLEASLTPESLARVQAAMRRALGGGGPDSSTDVYDQPCRDGSVKHVEITTRAIRDAAGALTSIVGISRDVTARVDAERALRASEERLREAQRLSRIGNWELDLRTGKLAWSDEVYRNFEVDPATFGGSFEAFFSTIHPDDRETFRAAYARSLATGSAYEIGYRLLMPDGRIKFMRERCETFRDPDGAPVRRAGVVQDVTELESLQSRLALASRLAALGTLVAGVAHEINNPLAGAMASEGYALEDIREILGDLRRGERIDPEALRQTLEEVAEALGDAQAGAQRIAHIVKDLTNFGRSDPHRSRVRVLDVVNDALRWLPSAVSQQVVIRVEGRGVPDIRAASGQIEQVLGNLLTNAAKAMPEGRTGTITVELGHGDPGMARIDVADDGGGMSPAVMERIFDPFFTTRGVGQGMGLGLSICHAIVTAHGGTITARSEVGRGSRFRVELPAVTAEA